MRRTATAAAAAFIAVSALAALSTGALASNGAATPFKVAYALGSSDWDCAGARVDNRVKVKDSETCLVTGDTSELNLVPGVYSGHPRGDLPWFPGARWGSDYDGSVALDWTVTVVDNGDGSFTVNAVAIFEYR